MGFISWIKSLKKPKRAKLGIALGSGGAKGFAHLGVLRAFEENGIEFQIVGGTSIGSIVGAFYADGYTSTDVFELIKKVEWTKIITGFMGGIDMSGLKKVISSAIGDKKIEELKKPFVAVATEIETGDAKIFYDGDVSDALCASASIPPYFKPVVIGDKRYVDGAFSDSIPAKHVRSLGANYVVGVDLSTEESSLLSKFIPTFTKKVEDPKMAGYENSDIMIHPDLKGYSSVSFNKAYEMYEIGYQSALKAIPSIISDLKEKKIKV